jgi:hypothetical protein
MLCYVLEKLLNPVSQLNPSLNQNSDMFINQNKYIKTEPSINDTGTIYYML